MFKEFKVYQLDQLQKKNVQIVSFKVIVVLGSPFVLPWTVSLLLKGVCTLSPAVQRFVLSQCGRDTGVSTDKPQHVNL